MNDQEFVTRLRSRVDAAPIDSQLEPSTVRVRARKVQVRRRVLGVVGSCVGVLAVGALAAPAALDALGSERDTPLLPAGAPTVSSSQSTASSDAPDDTYEAPLPTRETNGVQSCPGYTPPVPEDGAGIGGLEGWWNSTPIDVDGSDLPVEEWPQEILDHPATAQVDTRTGAVLESFDRRTCTVVDGYAPPADLPQNAIVVLDAVSGEILAQQGIEP